MSLSSVKLESSGFADLSRKLISAFHHNKDALCIWNGFHYPEYMLISLNIKSIKQTQVHPHLKERELPDYKGKCFWGFNIQEEGLNVQKMLLKWQRLLMLFMMLFAGQKAFFAMVSNSCRKSQIFFFNPVITQGKEMILWFFFSSSSFSHSINHLLWMTLLQKPHLES